MDDELDAALAAATRKHEAHRELHAYARYMAARTQIIESARAAGITWREIGSILGEHPANTLNKQARALAKQEAGK